ncbi:transposase [Thalassotalea litorea]|uniref:Transposase n=1 Tax=Thalassotalea litorea TaxID=2020715 RepID=A0A5R9IRR8_9GAMM|nr:transposase [Thalassotalea litorea]TLU64598.1 transposase [Thalassotalea litorea]
MPTPRSKQVCLQATPYYHCISRCVRRAYLCGKDHVSDRSYEHRRGWIEKRLLFLSQIFCIDICAYAVMSNHCHLVLHINHAQALKLNDEEVVNRWHKVCKGTLITQQFALGNQIDGDLLPTLKQTISIYRNRLFSVSWFMRLLNEPIARMANAEDECTGRFWEGRFVSQALLNESALAACMAYVDLNPVRAGIVDIPEKSEFTSIRRRIKALLQGKEDEQIMPFSDKAKSKRSETLPFNLDDYLKLVDFTGKTMKNRQVNVIDSALPGILSRLNISSSNWYQLTTKFEDYFKGPVGNSVALSDFCRLQNRMRRPNIAVSKQLFG